jgi:large subunit ribosomal protein L25
MAAVTLNAKARPERGTRAARRLRQSGRVPAVLYGHEQENVTLSVPGETIRHIVHQGAKLVDLQGDVSESALIRQVQWDTLGIEVLHIDLYRVSAGERVEMSVAVVLRGEAPGAKTGGVVEHVLHEVEIECPVTSLPDRLEININHLALGDSIFAREIPLPEGARLLTDEDLLVVHCVEVKGVDLEEVAGAPEAGEPEVIGRKAEADEEEED